MKPCTIQSFSKWPKVVDYESDETTVTLFGANGKALAEFNYPMFTRADFERLKAANSTPQ